MAHIAQQPAPLDGLQPCSLGAHFSCCQGTDTSLTSVRTHQHLLLTHCSTFFGHTLPGDLLATASLDSSVRVWRVPDGQCVQTLEGPGDGVEWLTWHPKGDVLLAGSEDFTMWMWLAQSGQCMQVLQGASGFCMPAACVGPCGRVLCCRLSSCLASADVAVTALAGVCL